MAEQGSITGEKQALYQTGSPQRQNFLLRYAKFVSRACGLVVFGVLWGSTVTSLQGQAGAPVIAAYYLLAVSLVVTFFEVTWILDKLACCVREGCCCRCWALILWVDSWRKFVLYGALSVPLFLEALRCAMGIVSGICLLILACLYLLKTFAKKAGGEIQRSDSTRSSVRHEMGVQTDVTADSEQQQPQHQPQEP